MLEVSPEPAEDTGAGGPCRHPASPLDVTVVLCERRWGALRSRETPLEAQPLGLGEAGQEKEGVGLFASIWEVGAPCPQAEWCCPTIAGSG